MNTDPNVIVQFFNAITQLSPEIAAGLSGLALTAIVLCSIVGIFRKEWSITGAIFAWPLVLYGVASLARWWSGVQWPGWEAAKVVFVIASPIAFFWAVINLVRLATGK